MATTQEFSYYLLAVGLSHSHRANTRGGAVPAHFVVGAMSLAQTALARLFGEVLGDAGAALEASLGAVRAALKTGTVGAVLLFLLPFWLSPLVGHHHALVFGVLIVAAILLQPSGLAGIYDTVVKRR